MAKVFITEYASLSKGDSVGEEPSITTQVVAIGGTSVQSAAFNTGTNFIRVHTDAICSIAFGTNPTATADSQRLAANQTEYYGVRPGGKVAVITNT